MKHWLKDAHFRSLLKNSSYLAISRVVAAVAGLATLAFAGRGLGLELFGMLILISSYVKAVSSLTKFESWQLVVRYGGQALAAGQSDEFRASTGFAFALDVVSGFAGLIIAAALLPFLGPLFGIPQQYLWLALLYCTLLPAMSAATPVGVLRAVDRFDLIGWQGSSYPIVRAILVGLAWWFEAPFEAYVAIWYATTLAGDIFLWFLAWRELRRRGLLEGIRPTLRPTSLPGAWRFAIHVNLTGSLTAALGPIARLIVGALVGPSAAALFRVASVLADSAQKPANLLGKVFYAEVVRMDLATNRPWKLMRQGIAVASSVALVAMLLLVVGGEPLVGLLFGDEFVGAYPILMVLLVATFIGIFSFALPSMLYALDRPDAPLKARTAGALVYLALVVPLTLALGVIGAAVAYVICYATIVLLLVIQLRREYIRVRAR